MAVSIDAARSAVLAHARRLGVEEVALDDALDRVLAHDALAPGDVPPFAASAMDGYAIRAADTADGDARLAIVGEARAGEGAAAHVEAGAAVRISTGAPVPVGADAVVAQELTTTEGATVLVAAPVAVGRNIRLAGEDIRAGQLAVAAGTVLGAAELGVLASLDIARPAVVRRPRVAIAGTGDELADPGAPLSPGAIRDTNGPALGGAVRRAGAAVAARVRVGDDLDATVETLGAALARADVLITTGGVSVGPHDHVRAALARLGCRELFPGVKLKPGRPTTAAVGEDGTLVFALPGNPVSALVAFHLFVLPALDAMLGRGRERRVLRAVADERLPGSRGRTTVVRCRTTPREDGWHVRPTKSQDSHVLTSMLGVDALAIVPEDRAAIDPGEPVEIELVG